MRLAAALAWYDEPTDSLERCLRSLAGVCDFLTIADGRWELFADEADGWSPPEQRATVELELDELEAAGMFIARLEPSAGAEPGSSSAPWLSQVEKRSWLYGAASSLADWTLVLDADEWIEHHDRDQLRYELEATDHLAAQIAGRTIFGPSSAGGTHRYPRLFSSAAGPLFVEGSHNGVRNVSGHWLTGDPAYVPVEPSIDVGAHLRIFHDQGKSRPRDRELSDRRYRTLRRRNRIEEWPRANRA